jgi:hypothetical protein
VNPIAIRTSAPSCCVEPPGDAAVIVVVMLIKRLVGNA